jgi:DNA invertase Pin-like site-specific DNA recombinase
VREVLHDRLDLGQRTRLDELSPARLERELVREPVADNVHQYRERGKRYSAAPPMTAPIANSSPVRPAIRIHVRALVAKRVV